MAQLALAGRHRSAHAQLSAAGLAPPQGEEGGPRGREVWVVQRREWGGKRGRRRGREEER